MVRLLHILTAALVAFPALADEPQVLGVKVEKVGMLWNVHVTVKHPDTGWTHYADGWEVLTPDGKRLAYRKLMHPHVDEQPFTRSLSGIVIPDGTRVILVRAHCSQDGWSNHEVRVELSP